MAHATFAKWHVTGMQALKSACDQAIEASTKAEDQALNVELQQLVTKLTALLTRHGDILAGFLRHAGAEVDAFHDEILDGINRGTGLMLKAAEDEQITDISLLSGSTVAINYFLVSFTNNTATTKALGLDEQSATFQQMAQAHEALGQEFQQLGEATIYPNAAQA